MEPTYSPIPANKLKLLGFENKKEGIPQCGEGEVLRDFDMGDWIKIMCYKRVKTYKQVCIEQPSTINKNTTLLPDNASAKDKSEIITMEEENRR